MTDKNYIEFIPEFPSGIIQISQFVNKKHIDFTNKEPDFFSKKEGTIHKLQDGLYFFPEKIFAPITIINNNTFAELKNHFEEIKKIVPSGSHTFFEKYPSSEGTIYWINIDNIDVPVIVFPDGPVVFHPNKTIITGENGFIITGFEAYNLTKMYSDNIRIKLLDLD